MQYVLLYDRRLRSTFSVCVPHTRTHTASQSHMNSIENIVARLAENSSRSVVRKQNVFFSLSFRSILFFVRYTYCRRRNWWRATTSPQSSVSVCSGKCERRRAFAPHTYTRTHTRHELSLKIDSNCLLDRCVDYENVIIDFDPYCMDVR